MKHPLENPSLAPYDFAFDPYRKRLRFNVDPKTGPYFNNERLIAKLWAEINQIRRPLTPPVQVILHTILPSMSSEYALMERSDGHFVHDGLPYLRRDILVLSSAVQWLATNVGSAFVQTPLFHDMPNAHPEREFELKWEDELKRADIPMVITHECTERCKAVGYTGIAAVFGGPQCHYDPKQASARDRAVLLALMKWLGSREGHAFFANFEERSRKAWIAARHSSKHQTEVA